MTYTFKERRFQCATCRTETRRFTWSHETPICRCGAPLVQAHAVVGDAPAVQGDEWPGGKVFENGFEQPTRFDSPSAYRKALAARGLQIRQGYEGTVGSPITRETLEKAKELVSRT